jgi:hypothetical protein
MKDALDCRFISVNLNGNLSDFHRLEGSVQARTTLADIFLLKGYGLVEFKLEAILQVGILQDFFCPFLKRIGGFIGFGFETGDLADGFIYARH